MCDDVPDSYDDNTPIASDNGGVVHKVRVAHDALGIGGSLDVLTVWDAPLASYWTMEAKWFMECAGSAW